MNERDNFILKTKRIKLIEGTKLKDSNIMEVNNKMDIDDRRKSNFSSTSNGGSITRGNSSNAKGDIRKLVIKNFKSKFYMLI